MLWKIEVPDPEYLDIEEINKAIGAYYDAAQRAYLKYENGILTLDEANQIAKDAEGVLESAFRAISGATRDPGSGA